MPRIWGEHDGNQVFVDVHILSLEDTERFPAGISEKTPHVFKALIDTGALAYMPVVGDEVYAGGGFEVVYDCVGSRDTVSQALRYASPRGRVVVLGCAGQLRKLDLTFLWARELRIEGYVGYGTERWDGRTRHTFEIALERMAADPRALGDLVTHVFPLKQYRDALRAAFDHRRSEAVKVALAPGRNGQPP